MREAYARFEGMGETPSKEKRTSASWWRAVGYYSGLER